MTSRYYSICWVDCIIQYIHERTTSRIVPQKANYLVLKHGLSLAWSSTIRAGCWSASPRSPLASYLPSTGITTMALEVYFYLCMSGCMLKHTCRGQRTTFRTPFSSTAQPLRSSSYLSTGVFTLLVFVKLYRGLCKQHGQRSVNPGKAREYGSTQ